MDDEEIREIPIDDSSTTTTANGRKRKSNDRSTSSKYFGGRDSPTDSDIEIMAALDAMPPEVPKKKKTTAPFTRYKSAPAIIHKFPSTSTTTTGDGENSSTTSAGQSSSIDQSKTTIEDLPDELLEEILCRLSAIDLVHYCSVVNKRFNAIISRPTFLPWKKLYARYLRNDPQAPLELQPHIDELTTAMVGELGPKHLIKFMSTMHKINNNEAIVGLQRVSNHPNYKAAEEIVKNIVFVDVFESTKETEKLGAIVATLILLSHSVDEMSQIIRLIAAQPAFTKTIYWSEYFYCLVTMLEYFTRRGILKDGRHHYQLKYAIYLMENGGRKSFREIANRAGGEQRASAAANRSAAQSSMNHYVARRTHSLTNEQYRIVNHDLQLGDYVRIVAFAGTGKTTTLLEYCRARPDKKFLVVFYNRSVMEDAERRFPPNATCKTIHTLAKAGGGWRYEHKLSGDISTKTIEDNTHEIQGVGRFMRIGLVRETLNRYFASDREIITSEFVPDEWTAKNKQGMSITTALDVELKPAIFQQADEYWTKMKDTRNTEVRMTHDGYLKLYQLQKPYLGKWDVLLIDEAQDCNPAALDIFKGQTHMPKILVGDGYQQIYSFRGAINALESVPATKTFYLTQSFRFGPEIAYVANAWMRSILGEKQRFLIGADKPSRLDGAVEGQQAVICRTNYTVFNEAVSIAVREQSRCLVVGSVSKPFEFEPLEVLFYLYLSENSRDPGQRPAPTHWYHKFKTYTGVKNFVQKINDKETLSRVGIIERHGVDTGKRIQSVKSCLVSDERAARFIVTTAHKSKGLEFDTVRIAGDFVDLDDPSYAPEDDEKNLLYVAMTRARKSLIINETIELMLARRLGRLIHYPVLPATTNETNGGDQSTISCTQCRREIVSRKYLLMKPMAVTFAMGLAIRPQSKLCKICVSETIENGLGDDEQDGVVDEEVLKKCYQFHLPFLG